MLCKASGEIDIGEWQGAIFGPRAVRLGIGEIPLAARARCAPFAKLSWRARQRSQYLKWLTLQRKRHQAGLYDFLPNTGFHRKFSNLGRVAFRSLDASA
jgi:hypothetical protein